MKYFLTTIGFYPENYPNCAGERHERCVGYFNTFEEAEKATLENWGDIYECGYYQYVVIEAIKPGLYSIDIHPTWYEAKWIESNAEYPLGRYEVTKIETPDFAECMCGWSIG